ncbi:hypothetical protein K450DRAFT_249828 [Umbelopsis ramanniana AG]|uniref:Uncharacterized protein n=1 Tax=Umbelopsis ramanniana AG TaxID=1314678 RepID=A0AAD5E7T3_UMBRA|nr:uncharacterized protein K450DRAFT_249828 [Umbelopsis ramanniana AG]KAI8577901.1 hypothetical protein K450DRAFT_249828 [Umbelopsis ramanniana AG]
MMQYATQKPNTSDEDQIQENINVYNYKEATTKISTKISHTSYENSGVDGWKQRKWTLVIMGGLVLLVVIFAALFAWAYASRGQTSSTVTQPQPQIGANLSSYYISPADMVSIGYNNTWHTLNSNTCIPLYNNSWQLSVSYINKIALAKFYTVQGCPNETLLGDYVVNTAVNDFSNVINVIKGSLNYVWICDSPTNC